MEEKQHQRRMGFGSVPPAKPEPAAARHSLTPQELRAVGDVFWSYLLSDDRFQPIFGDLEEAIMAHREKSMAAAHAHCASAARQSVDFLIGALANAGKRQPMAPPEIFSGPLRTRYRGDHPLDKEALARYVADTFFAERVCCFIQASTAAIYLGEQLRKRGVHEKSLFVTNSAIFPLTILQNDAKYAVYTLCGPGYHEECGAWLAPEQDESAYSYLKGNFKRSVDPLTVAFITPRAITFDSGIYFERDESAWLARTLMELSPKVVLMTTADRIFHKSEDVRNIYSRVHETHLRKVGHQMVLVISGAPDGGRGVKDCAERLSQDGLEVHYQVSASNWDIVPAKS